MQITSWIHKSVYVHASIDICMRTYLSTPIYSLSLLTSLRRIKPLVLRSIAQRHA